MRHPLDRRTFMQHAAVSTAAVCVPWPGTHVATQSVDLDAFIEDKMQRDHIPGVAACVVKGPDLVWSGTYGYADLERQVPMSLDHLQNIASISKTFTTTALMQLNEAGLVDLDQDVNDFFPFAIRNPAHPTQAITVRHLLTHTSSINDGLAYGRLYACGDPRFSLEVWLREYFSTGGQFYSAEENFHPWSPNAQRFTYNNVAFGLLGRIVEVASGIPFPAYCRRNIFARFGMGRTAWMLAEIDLVGHTVPYTWVAEGRARGPTWGGVPLGVIREGGPSFSDPLSDGYHANCPYNHPNYPDGFLRTSVNQLSRYLRAYLGGGAFEGRRILTAGSIEQLFTDQRVDVDRTQGLTWYAAAPVEGNISLGHGGRRPGIEHRRPATAGPRGGGDRVCQHQRHQPERDHEPPCSTPHWRCEDRGERRQGFHAA